MRSHWAIIPTYFIPDIGVNHPMPSSGYSIIKSRKGKRITTRQLEEAIGSQHKVRYAINHLLKENRIKRIRVLGVNRIEYSYVIKT